jgi:cytosine/adenosine deaminase-related metal-dependent hydrolase
VNIMTAAAAPAARNRAALILVRFTNPHGQPMFNVYSNLVYAPKGSDVQHVMINGQTAASGGEYRYGLELKKAAEWETRIRASVATLRR